MKRAILFVSLLAIGGVLFAGLKEDAMQLRDEAKALRQQADAKDAAADVLIQQLENPGTPDPDPDPDPLPGVIDFAIVAVEMPRDDDLFPHWPFADRVWSYDHPANLRQINPDGTTQLLTNVGPDQAAADPQVSFDGKFLSYSIISGLDHDDVRNYKNVFADVFIRNLETGQVTQVTHQPGDKNVKNLGAAWLSPDQLMFVSDGDVPWLFSHRSPQLHVIDIDGKNLEKVGHLNLHGALHPSIMPNGRSMWNSGEGMGWRGQEQWGLWHSNPDGTDWGPLWSALTSHTGLPFPVHFQTALPDGQVVVTQYYKQKNFGTGILHKFDPSKGFRSPADLFEPREAINLTPLSPLKDIAAPTGGPEWNNTWVGKWSHPAAAPGGMLATWTGPSPANIKAGGQEYFPSPRGTIAFATAAEPLTSLEKFTVVKQSESFNYIQPVPLVPYSDIHGITAPPELPWLPQGQHDMLPVGTPYGIIGTDTVYVRESATEGLNTPWKAQGSDVAVGYENEDIEFVRILTEELSANKNTMTLSFGNVAPERLKILADIPITKPSGSFQAKLPADAPFTFQLLDKDHSVLSMAQTWRMVRSGEVHRNCKGCHAHWHPSAGLTEAEWNALPDPVDLTAAVPVGYDFVKDIQPILEQHCNSCHESDDEPAAESLETRLKQPSGARFDPNYWTPFRALDSELYKRITTDNIDQRMPLNHDPLSNEEIDTIRRWIDTGCQDKNSNVDDQKPTLHIESPRRRTEPITEIVFGAADSYGLNDTLTTVEASWIEGNLFGSHTESDGVYTIPLPAAVSEGTVTISVTDANGNVTSQVRTFKK